MSKSKKNSSPTKAEAEQFDMLFPILNAILSEIKELSKKKQDDALNPKKISMANRVLIKVKALLKNDPTVEFLDLLDENDVPTNSDAVLIIAQFKAAMEQYKDKHYNSSYPAHWITSD